MYTMTTLKNQQKWCEFLDLYRENSCLWDIHSSTYMRRDLRNASYQVLMEKYKEIELDGNMDSMKKKIDMFRGGFKREVRKIHEAREKSGYEYTPTLWYFHKLTFLDNLDYSGDCDSTKIKESNESDDPTIEYIDIPEESPESEPDPVVKYRLKMRNAKFRSRPRIKPYARDEGSPSCDSKQASSGESADDCTTYCASLKIQMKELDTQQKFIAQKLISDVIFLARTSQLTLDSSILIGNCVNF